MSIWKLVFREIRYRKLNFALAVLGVAVAIGCAVSTLLLLRKHDLRTGAIIAAKEAETQKQMAALQDDVRKITVKMGFNVLILPKGQRLSDFSDEGAPLKFMPEEYATTLAREHVATINHVLPSLTMRVKWPEQERKILVTGVRGEVYVHSAKQKPILEAVPAGTVIAGSELHRSLHLTVGQKIKFQGHEFTVGKLLGERGTWDDETLWMDLKTAQELLGHPGQINSILALECNCETTRLAQIRGEIGKLLPDTDVVEFASQAIARAEARNRTAQEAQAALEAEKLHRQQMRGELEWFGALLLPLAAVGAALWIGLLALGNCRDRRAEAGIYRALGLRRRQLLAIFLLKAFAVGACGAVLGCLAGLWPAVGAGPKAATLVLSDWRALALIAAAGPVLAMLASWLPILWLACQDPAVVLQED